ncbi:Zinc finger CCCH domain-containing protein 24 [Forsythia ovata]|uniref:Zinc finger CCCH domain-containing protein 24 n=1 Tax=Forsythia ovata TaxID=205694 RepID=A0ABD1T4D1_9LAMI
MDALESSGLPNPPENVSESGAAETNQSEKRKRESDPEPDQAAPQQKQQHPLWKTSLCSYFRRSDGLCSHGDSCCYAHGEAELKPRPDNTWDPTSERAKKIAKTEPDNAKSEAEGGVMMTDAFVAAAEEESCSSGLSKCLVNLPMKWSLDKLRSFLNEQGILFKSAKKKRGMVVGFVTFESAAQVKTAVEELDGKSVGNNWTLKVTDVIPRSFEKKNKTALLPQTTQQSEKPAPVSDSSDMTELKNDQGDDPIDGTLALDGSVSKGRSVRDVVTPLAHMAYADQLEHKKNSLMQTLKRLTRNARKACPNGVSLPEWILKSREIGGLPCKLEGILESPLVDGYRNKCEFSVGYSLQGRPTVGFLLGNFRDGVTAIEEPVDCPNVSRVACKYAAIFQEFLQHSAMPIWNRLNNTGFWRQLTVREGRTPCEAADVDNPDASILEVMLMVQVCTKGFDDGLVKSEFERMAQAFTMGAAGECPPLPLTALVIQDHTGISNVASPDAPLQSVSISKKESDSGLQTYSDVVEPRIHDYINNLWFSISPTAFFQVNTLAAEKLYSLAGDWAGLGPDTLLFDVCCGTGTIGLTLAHRVGMVVGIEMNASAITDAQRNAEMNGIDNCRFVCGKAEDVMGSLLKEYLSLPQKQDETDTLQRSEDEMKSAEETIDSADCAPGPEVSYCLEHENGRSPNGISVDESQIQKNCTSQNRNTMMQQFKNVVAIVDPPRVGLHPTVIKVLRTHSRLSRLVYISCNPESLVANSIELCTPSADKTEKGNNKNNRGWRNMSSAGLARHRAKSMPNSEPFKPVKAMAVDLFPHTSHCELVMLLER